MTDLALDGVRVVEVAEWLFVPSTGALLADWGADVIHVERRNGGDPFRGNVTQGIGHKSGGVDMNMAMANRGKRSFAVDLHTERGLDVLHRLIETADVFLTSWRPKALLRLGLDADTLLDRYPRLVYGRGHGFGVRGPDADESGFDATAYWARGGVANVLSTTALDYPPQQRPGMGDRTAGVALAFGVAMGLAKQARTGAGTVVDVSLLAGAMSMLSTDIIAALVGHAPEPAPARALYPNPLTGTYRTQDGRHIQLAFLQGDRYWTDFCRLIGREDLLEDPRFEDLAARGKNRDACVAELDKEFATRTFEEWKALMSTMDAPWAPHQKVAELIDDPQVIANGYIGDVVIDGEPRYRLPRVPVQMGGQPPELRRAPEHGEHTEDVLLELGFDWEDIAALKSDEVVL
jgi:crotonobetainyl-CoA:carnitine CoA-transferase CaiB-like acyl-CoA transferase